jgi:lipoprotein-releasing system ATP-binding protein
MRLSLQNLSRVYQDGDKIIEVIGNLNFEFPNSGIVAVTGESGVGKSTLLQLLGGLDRPTSGNIFFDDTDIGALSGDQLSSFRGKNIGFVFQFHNLLPEFSALENVAMPLIIQGIEFQIAQKCAKELLERVGLGARLEHRPSALSGGEQQRVAIARALVSNPKLILMDEPTGNLDPVNSVNMKSLLVELNRELNNLMIVVTHSLELAASLDRAYRMQPGGQLI